MGGMGALPIVVGGQRDDTDSAPHPIVGASLAEKRSVAAIVLNEKQTHQKTRRRDRQN